MDVYFFQHSKQVVKIMWCSTSKGRPLNGKVRAFFSALKWHAIYQNWWRHSNFTTEEGSKILIVFLIILRMFSSIPESPQLLLHVGSWCKSHIPENIIWHFKILTLKQRLKYAKKFQRPFGTILSKYKDPKFSFRAKFVFLMYFIHYRLK